MKELVKQILVFVVIGLIVISVFTLLGKLIRLSDFNIGWYSGILSVVIYRNYGNNA